MNALVLSRRDFREYDQIISCFTKEQGRIDCIARGIKKPASKNAAALEPFSFVTIGVAEGKESAYITTVQLQEYFSSIRQDPTKAMYAGFLVSFVERALLQKEVDVGLFDFLLFTLSTLAEQEEPRTVFLDAAVLRIMTFLGFTPECLVCVHCTKPAEGATTYIFDLSEGGIVCRTCQAEGNTYIRVSEKDLTLLHTILATSHYSLHGSASLHRFILAYIEFYMEKSVEDWGTIEKLLK